MMGRNLMVHFLPFLGFGCCCSSDDVGHEEHAEPDQVYILDGEPEVRSVCGSRAWLLGAGSLKLPFHTLSLTLVGLS